MVRYVNRASLKTVDCWPYSKKVIKYAGAKPLDSLGRMSKCPTFSPDDVCTDGAGNVTAMPQLIGRPCFGIPTAYLRERYRPEQMVPRARKPKPTSKCDRCKVRSACLKVVKERIKVVASGFPEFTEALKIWGDTGGFKPGGFDCAIEKLGEKGWRNIYQFIQKVQFENSNDQEVLSYWDLDDQKAAKRNARSRAEKLRTSWLRGEETQSLIIGLNQGMEERKKLLHDALVGDDVPGYLTRFPLTSIDRIGYAWWGREFARLTGQKINPNRIANILINYRRNLDIPQSSLRSSLKSDFIRINKLESSALYNGGSPIWPVFIHPILLV